MTDLPSLGSSITVGRTWDANSNLDSVTNDDGKTNTYTYDSRDRILTVTDADTKSFSYSYDRDDHLCQITDPNGTVITRKHDVGGRVIEVAANLGAGVVGTDLELYGYDGSGRLAAAKANNRASGFDNPQQTLTAYDSRDLQVEEVFGVGFIGDKISNTYDGDGTRTSCTYPDGVFIGEPLAIIEAQHDELDRLISLTDPDRGDVSGGICYMGPVDSAAQLDAMNHTLRPPTTPADDPDRPATGFGISLGTPRPAGGLVFSFNGFETLKSFLGMVNLPGESDVTAPFTVGETPTAGGLVFSFNGFETLKSFLSMVNLPGETNVSDRFTVGGTLTAGTGVPGGAPAVGGGSRALFSPSEFRLLQRLQALTDRPSLPGGAPAAGGLVAGLNPRTAGLPRNLVDLLAFAHATAARARAVDLLVSLRPGEPIGPAEPIAAEAPCRIPVSRELHRGYGNDTELTMLDDLGTGDIGWNAQKQNVRRRHRLADGTSILDRVLAYNARHFLTSETRNEDGGLADVYTLDDSYRIESVEQDLGGATPRADRIDYQRDGVGNLLAVTTTEGGVPTTQIHTVNAVNQTTDIDGVTRVYDANGNLIDDGTFLYEYDFKNQLFQVREKATGDLLLLNLYFADGRRALKVNVPLGVDVSYFYDGDRMIVEAPLGLWTAAYVYGPDGPNDVVHAMLNPIDLDDPSLDRFWFHRDARGNVAAVSFENPIPFVGQVAQRIVYDAFGAHTRTFVAGGDPATPLPSFLFQGALRDPETGLYLLGNRFYDPRTGLFLQPGPLLGALTGNTPYGFVGLNPASHGDARGSSPLLTPR